MVVDIIALQQQGLNCKTFFVSRIILGSVYDIAILATNIPGHHVDTPFCNLYLTSHGG